MPTTLYHTQLTPAAITATTAAAGYPALNLASAALAKPWRATSTNNNELIFDFGAIKALGGLLLHDVNFAAAAIATSLDGSTYTARGTLTTYANADGKRRGVFSLVGINARYVRAIVNPSGNRAYVTQSGSGTISVINTLTNAVLTTIATGTISVAVAVHPSGHRAYVANSASNNVSVIDTATNVIIATFTAGTTPQAICVNAAGTLAYVGNFSGLHSAIDLRTNTLIGNFALGGAYGIVFNGAGTRAYAVNGTTTLSIIDPLTHAVIGTVTVGAAAAGVAANAAGTRVYTANSGGASVSVIDTATNTVVATVTVGSTPVSLAVNPAGTRVYVTNQGGTTVSVIDTSTNTVTATITVGSAPKSVAVNAAGTRAYVTNSGGTTLSVIDTSNNTVTATITIGSAPLNVATGQDISTDLLPYWRAGAAYTMAVAVTLAQAPNKGYSVQTAFPRVSTRLPNGRTAVATTGMPIDEIRWTFLRKYQDSLDVLMTQLRAGTVVVDMGLPQFPQHIWPVTTLDDVSDRTYPKANSESSSVTLTEVA